MKYLIGLFLVLLPWSRNPFTGISFPVPLATGFAIISILPIFIYKFRSCVLSKSSPKVPFVFFLYCLISLCIGYYNLLDLDRLDLILSKSESVSYIETGLKKTIQIFYAFSAFYVFSQFPHAYIKNVISAWKIGFLLAVITHIIVRLTCGDEILPRAGTFEEGNFAGLYYILTFNLIYFNDQKLTYKQVIYTLVCGVGVLLTESTIGIFVYIVNFYLVISNRINSKNRLYLVLVFFIVFALILIFDVNHFYDKLFSDITMSSFSKYDRMSSFIAGFEIFKQYPIFGLGVEAYGFLVNDYLDQSEFQFYDFSFRRIPNNIYIEVLSEFGIVGGSILYLFFRDIIKLTWRKYFVLTAGIISILLYWIAFPTFSVAYIWVYLGFCFLSQKKNP